MHLAQIRRDWRIVLACLAIVAVAQVNAQDNAADAASLITALAVRAGSVVAEIGAGTGDLTVAIARQAGASGRVYSSELGADRLASLRGAIDTAGARNVTVIEGDINQSNFPDQCCDALFMRAVYHHFADPPAMNASIWRSLKPGGLVAVIDFPPRGTESANPAGRASDADYGTHHGVTAETVIKELAHAGFVQASVDKRKDTSFVVVMKKPG
jgi:ubiquinone/menaquinone biosynthesis C-methylase UbiE